MAKIVNISNVSSKYILPDGTMLESYFESNISTIENMTASFKKERFTSKTIALPLEEIEQKIVLVNESDKIISNIRINDLISSNVAFKIGSFNINGVKYPDINPNEFKVPDLKPNESAIVTYIIIVNENPTSNVISLVSNITYDVEEELNLTEKSNEIKIEISKNIIVIKKTANKTKVSLKEKIMFENIVINKGTELMTEVTFKDILPTNAKFVEGSVKIDDVINKDLNPAQGFVLGELKPNEQKIITFEVIVE